MQTPADSQPPVNLLIELRDLSRGISLADKLQLAGWAIAAIAIQTLVHLAG